MPSQFDEQFAQSGFPDLLIEFGESVVYHPRGGGRRTINAIITRDPPAFYEGVNAVFPAFTIRVHDDATTGITSKEIDTGGDEIALLKNVGDAIPTRRTIMKRISQSAGVNTFAVK